jgi:hypothetical protein
VNYGRFVVEIRPNKTETHQVILTVGGDLIQYPGDVSTRSSNLTTSKCLWNSNLLPLVLDGNVYIEVQKGMYGLPQAGILANQLLARRLAIHGYHQTKSTPGLWRHVTRPI